MSTTYYMRLKDDRKLDQVRDTLNEVEKQINVLLEKEAELLHEMVIPKLEEVLNKDNFNKQFCNAAGWYASYPDEPEDYHLRRTCLETIEDIKVEIGTYSSGGFHWRLNSLKDGYYDLEYLDDNDPWGMTKDLKVFNMPRSKEQLKAFMKQYKDKVEIVDEYDEVYTVTQFLKKVDEQ